MPPSKDEMIAGFGIMIDLVVLIVATKSEGHQSNWDEATFAVFLYISLFSFVAFTGLLHGAAQILKIENVNLVSSEFIGFTGYVILLTVLWADSLISFLNLYRFAKVFATIIMWIMTAGMAKFMYRIKLSKAFLVSLPLFVVTLCILLQLPGRYYTPRNLNSLSLCLLGEEVEFRTILCKISAFAFSALVPFLNSCLNGLLRNKVEVFTKD